MTQPPLGESPSSGTDVPAATTAGGISGGPPTVPSVQSQTDVADLPLGVPLAEANLLRAVFGDQMKVDPSTDPYFLWSTTPDHMQRLVMRLNRLRRLEKPEMHTPQVILENEMRLVARAAAEVSRFCNELTEMLLYGAPP